DSVFADKRVASRSVNFDQRYVFVAAVPGPMDGIAWNAAEVAGLHQEAVVVDENPNFSFGHVVDLLGVVNVRVGVISGTAHSNHHVAVIAVNHLGGHGATAYLEYVLAFFDVV